MSPHSAHNSMIHEAESFVHEVEYYFGPPAKVNGKEPVMTTLNFTVAAMYDPDPSRNQKTGRIKTTTDKYVSFWPSDKHLFAIGQTYSAVCDAREWQGKTYYTIKSPGKGGNITSGGAPQTAQAPAPAAAASFTSLSKDELILRQAVAKSCIESQQTQADADSWVAWILKEAPAAAPVDAGGSMPPADDGLNDEIPF